MDKALNIANYMLSKKTLTPKQVQKLLYYAYSIYLIKYNNSYTKDNMNRLFDEPIEAWEHGPVVREVYDHLKYFGHSGDSILLLRNEKLSDIKTENFINKILAVYGQYSGYELEKMTHNEIPWQVTFEKGRNKEITDESIFEYFSSKYKKDNIN